MNIRFAVGTPTAPIFHSRTFARSWVSLRDGSRIGPRDFGREPVTAFCALGNPASFWNTLHDLDINVVERFTFDDHHRYTPAELRRILHCTLAHSAKTIVTTQKDLMNLCVECESLLPGLDVFWLEISVEIDREEELLAMCGAVLPAAQGRV